MAKFYITTAIDYVNDDPHIGHMYEKIVADVIARHRRRMGDDVWFLTGTDEHGQKIERSAEKEGVLPIELVDRVVANYHELLRKLNVSNDDFVRTTQQRHRLGVLELIARIQARMPDDIYLGQHAGWYCQTEETFIPENQVKDGRDQDAHPVERTTEQNYFFKLSRYTQPLLEHYRRNPDFVRPRTRLNEVVAFVEQGLKDLSISRTAVSWGIPFPGNPDHVIYVWMDALTNYISALGFGSGGDDDARFRHYWPADIHLIGKDIVRFHAVYWPAFLMSAGLDLPRQVYGHGFLLSRGEKMSKSVGNVVDPMVLADRFGVDALRYFLLREVSFGQDGSYSAEAIVARANAELANSFGNLAQRTLSMILKNLGGILPAPGEAPEDLELAVLVTTAVTKEIPRAFDRFAFSIGLEAWLRAVFACNQYVDAQAPWALRKTDPERMAAGLGTVVVAVRQLTRAIAPILPDSADKLLALIDSGGGGRAIAQPTPLFPRLELDED